MVSGYSSEQFKLEDHTKENPMWGRGNWMYFLGMNVNRFCALSQTQRYQICLWETEISLEMVEK
jgi:hypothetical protein